MTGVLIREERGRLETRRDTQRRRQCEYRGGSMYKPQSTKDWPWSQEAGSRQGPCPRISRGTRPCRYCDFGLLASELKVDGSQMSQLNGCKRSVQPHSVGGGSQGRGSWQGGAGRDTGCTKVQSHADPQEQVPGHPAKKASATWGDFPRGRERERLVFRESSTRAVEAGTCQCPPGQAKWRASHIKY